MEEVNKKVGTIIKDGRNRLGYSLEYVKNALKRDFGIELDTSSISRYENGTVKNMNAAFLRALCQINSIDYINIFKMLGYIHDDADILQHKKLDSRSKRQLTDLIAETTLMFDDENISLEDKQKMMMAIQEAFYDAKLKNKRNK